MEEKASRGKISKCEIVCELGVGNTTCFAAGTAQCCKAVPATRAAVKGKLSP